MGNKNNNPNIWFLILLFGGLYLLDFNSYSKINNLSERHRALNMENNRQSVVQSLGRAVYVKYCLTCHQSNGSGVPGMHPPLGPGSWVGKDPKELITILLKGLTGKIEVNDEIYKDNMPSQSKLSDAEMAEVLTYIRTNFGNDFKPVSQDMVRKTRTNQ